MKLNISGKKSRKETESRLSYNQPHLKCGIAVKTIMNTRRAIAIILVFTIATAVCFVTSYVVAKILLILNNDFGAGDMSAFLYWTACFAVALLFPAVLFAFLTANTRTIHRLSFSVLFGGLAGFGWTLLNRWFLGPWFGAWSFNVFYCWVLGGVFGILTVAFLARPQQYRLF